MEIRKTGVRSTTKNEKSRREKGITLVALVITIIVLLILAGVGINMAISSDGLFAKAHEAVDKWNQSVAEEGDIYENLLLKANELNGGGTTGPTDPPTPTLPEGWDENKVGSVFTDPTTKKQVPIPNGYTVSEATGEKTIDDGLVIYQDGDDGDSTPVTDETKATALTTRNQYVWIPVDNINDMIMCKQNKSGSICDIKIENGILKCKTHPIETDTAEKWQEQIVGRLYIGTSTSQQGGNGKIYTYTMDFTKKDQTYNTSGYYEPDTVSADASNGVELSTLQNDFYAMAKSVATYGGFYIGRYEIGENGNSKKDQKVLTADSSNGSNYLGVSNWYGLYTASKKDGTNTSPNSHMIWGSQYDQVIKFIGEQSHTGHIENKYQPRAQQLSGTTTPMKNIYDLEGNYLEWTAEARSTYYRVYRGNYYNTAAASEFYPASFRYNHKSNPANTDGANSSRTSLYL